jgi:hypothetical protein
LAGFSFEIRREGWSEWLFENPTTLFWKESVLGLSECSQPEESEVAAACVLWFCPKQKTVFSGDTEEE